MPSVMRSQYRSPLSLSSSGSPLVSFDAFTAYGNLCGMSETASQMRFPR